MHRRRTFSLSLAYLLGVSGFFALILLGSVRSFAAPDDAKPITPQQAAFFETNVRPLLFGKCFSCHGDALQAGGLRLDSRAAVLRGNAHGPAINSADPEKSPLLRVVHYDGAIKMPPAGKLSAMEIAALTAWVKMGAPWPDAKPTQPGAAPAYVITPAQKQFWSFRPIRKSPLPKVANAAWVKSPIDRFILAGLEAKGLKPAPPADKHTLIRRVYFDLIGLPPTPEAIEAFIKDTSPNAFAKVVDTLLASPQYGERWGRHWLDVARYSDSNGLDENIAFGNAYRYRDYVIDSFNKDKPYNQFIMEQLAGDQMPSPDENIRNERLVATGFLSLGAKVLAEPDKPKLAMDIVDEQIEVTSKAFLGLTVACARCHNHKFDPIPTRDYYGLAGIFKSTQTMQTLDTVARLHQRPLMTAALQQQVDVSQAKLKVAQADLKTVTDQANSDLQAELHKNGEKYLQAGWQLAHQAPMPHATEELAKTSGLRPSLISLFAERLKTFGDLDAAHKMLTDAKDGLLALPEHPEKYYSDAMQQTFQKQQATVAAIQKAAPVVPMALAVEDGTIENVHIHIRGSTQNLGDEAPRHFLMVLDGDKVSIDPRHSGRLELAQWLTRPENPLPARVEVNRIWQDHFGMALVRTPDNWGLLGDKPANPQLLDWLAATFIEDGWSFKKMHRRILLSSTYQMSSTDNPKGELVDPDNRLVWHANRRRLEAEPYRDSILAVAGTLDTHMGGTLLTANDNDYITNDQSGNTAQYDSPRRSVYLPVIRNALYDMFQAFDFGDPSLTHAQRATTTVAPQALYILNSPFVLGESRHFAESLLAQSTVTDEARLRLAYRRAFGRTPSPQETIRAMTYLAKFGTLLMPLEPNDTKRHLRSWESLCQIIFASNEFIYVN